ncbi:MAG: EamA family transporter [Nitrospirales bacterium]|nr:EamA family transporter [Nitrospirales bacterium]
MSYVYILTAIVLWSALGVFIRFAGTSVPHLIFFPNVISLALMAFFLFRKRHREEIPAGKGLLPLLLLGPLSLANTFSFFYAYQNTSIANAVLTHYTAPVMVAFLALFFLKEKVAVRVALSVALATAGLWIMLGVSPARFWELLRAGDRDTAGILSGILSGFFYALLIITLRRLAPRFTPLVMTFFQNSIIALLLLPWVEVKGLFSPGLWALAVMGIAHSTIAPLLYFKGMQRVSANQAAILGYIEPVCAILLGFVFFGESIQHRVVAGGCMILFSGYMTIRAAVRQRHPAL